MVLPVSRSVLPPNVAPAEAPAARRKSLPLGRVPNRGWRALAALALLSLADACTLVEPLPPRRASALIGGRTLDRLTGVAVFVEEPDGVRVSVTVQHAPPGEHGVFVFEGPSCAAAGGHFNPARVAHGSRASGEHHAGDLGNLSVDEHGLGTLEVLCDDLWLDDSEWSVVGRLIVLSERADDFATQPWGDSGAKLGCGVILAESR